MCQIIDGAAVAKKIREEIKKDTQLLLKNKGIIPGLIVLLVGDNPASQIYVKHKVKACLEVGFNSQVIKLSADTSEEHVLQTINKLNLEPEIHGILVQLPLPEHIREEKVIAAISPKKDVDGFHPINMGKLLTGKPRFVACTPFGCLKLLEEYGIDMNGKHAVVVGRSNIVGKPIAALLLHKNATVTVCHSRTVNLAGITRQADILVAAIGKPKFITDEMIKPGAIVLDVGINRLATGKVVGDVDFAAACKIAGMITPVPRGVGPMTIAMLLTNTLKAVNYLYE
ncbi:MAG: bifunctional methylenetetrahydrofolate dehydrogenase/methenyltetrahydrofolate cyclohydrolase FolD [Firmicutes bacterium HGW-Firmicutes-12]|nr:MAG: bifunctional methylenetetrahydrofolate dehydrogenase/methenyltetrahydrofolate cyclohydrolase FolD [Firmicutes bacterium HGW-Firmicutes-12]